MSFAILRHGKIKSTSRGAAISHNHRLGDVDQVNIDKDQKHLNRCFMGDGLAERIAGKLPAKIRKDAVVAVEVLLTSGPEFFDGIEKDRVKLAKNPAFLAWVEKSLDWAKKEFGGNLVDATLHMDESTPHIHLLAVPLTKDGRLCAKEVMARTEMQRRQTGYAEAMKPFGLARGEPAAETKRRHIGLKENPSSGGKAAQVEAQFVQKQAELERQTAKAEADLMRLQKLSKEWAEADLVRVNGLKVENSQLTQKVETMTTQITELSNKNTQLETEMKALADTWKAKTAHRDAELAKGTLWTDIDTTGVTGASKPLLERIEDWVKGLVAKLGKRPAGLVEGGDYVGNVLEVMPGGGAWAQRTNRDGSWVVHEGKAPPLETLAEVKFKGGVSQVKGMDNQFQQQKPGATR